VDFDSKEAADVVIKAWNGKTMNLFSNSLDVAMFDDQHK
jgi:hypothetical protein